MIKSIFEKGIAKHLKQGDDSEKKKINTLRGGSTGMMTKEGTIIGQCAAAAYLRYKGVQTTKVDLNKELMFAGGRLNEDHWLAVLKDGYDGPILCEEEIPTKWQTTQGVDVTGRPDIILGSGTEKNFTPECGIELKQCMSVNSAYNVMFGKEPQLKHLMQSAHYMWQLGCSFELWYTQRNNLDLPGWMEFRPFPRPGERDSDVLGYRYYRWGDINPKTNKPRKHQITETEYLSGQHKKAFASTSKILPFVKGFKLELREGQLYYQEADRPDKEWTRTIVQIDDIRRFYDYIVDMDKENKVPKPAKNLKPSGDPYNWKFSAYSDLKHLDPEHCKGQNLDEWVSKVKYLVDSKL